MGIDLEKKYKILIIAVLAIVVATGFIKLLVNPVISIFLRVALVFIVLMFAAVIISKFRSTRHVETWARAHNLIYHDSVKQQVIYTRIHANPKKQFFTEEKFLKIPNNEAPSSIFKLLTKDTHTDSLTGPYVEGKIESRRLWFYPMFEKIRHAQEDRKMYGWCMEFETGPIPVHVFVSKKFISKTDTHDTESNEFEQAYQVKADPGSPPLQLLDPAMMHLILESKISSIEFSDDSVVLRNITLVPSHETLNRMLTWGLKIAHQVDHNFPASKR